MPRQAVKASWRRVAVAGAGALLAAALLAGPSTATAASSVKVDCSSASLQAAIADAAPGTKLIVTGTCVGHFAIDKDLSLLGQDGAVLDAQGAGATLQVDPGTTVSVSNLTITGGGNAGIDNSGTLTLAGSTVSDNTGFFGGGIDSAGTLTLRATTVTHNTAFTGGGITSLRRSADAPTPALTLQDSTVSANHGDHGAGGIDSAGVAGPVTLSNTKVIGNTSDDGAGGILTGDVATLNNSTVSGNTTGQIGAGIFVNSGSLTLNRTTVSGNTAGQDGGGIANFFSATVALRNATVTNNAPNNCAPAGSVAGCSG
jgi:nitrous oxidase accessory protein NosD